MSTFATFVIALSKFQHRLIGIGRPLLFCWGHTLIEVKLIISDKFISLQLLEQDFGVIIIHSCTHSSQFMTILSNTDRGFTWHIHWACMRDKWLSDLQCRVDLGSKGENTLLLVDPTINTVTLGKSIFKSSSSAFVKCPTKPPSQWPQLLSSRRSYLKTHLSHKICDCSCWRILIFNIINDQLVLQTVWYVLYMNWF